MLIDVFNGDADGICALLQLRLNEPADSHLVTGTKRDIELLQRVSVTKGDSVTVLDISLDKNRSSLIRILEQGAEVFYVDHHQSGETPVHPKLKTLINTSPNTCTSLLVNDYLQDKYTAWAVTAAFGDNLIESAEQVASKLSLTDSDLKQLQNLGTCINYNSYGDSIDDLYFSPDALYRELMGYTSPFDFIAEKPEIFEKLLFAYTSDLAKAQQMKADYCSATTAVYILPDEAWARRVNGVFSNELANQYPSRAHAILRYNANKGYQVSVRAPLNNKTGADELCSAFPSGGGRKSAAGINHLPVENLSAFVEAFSNKYL